MATPYEAPDLWLGVEALQMGFLQPESFINCVRAWANLKSKSLSEILVEQDHLKPESHAQLRSLIADRCQAAGQKKATRDHGQSTTAWDPAQEQTRLRYRSQKSLNEGGLGRLYEALDLELNRCVALKEIKDRINADDPEVRRQFKLEAEITGGLEHPGIVPVYGLGVYADGRPYYAMRLIQGETLSQAIARLHDEQATPPDAASKAAALRQLLNRFISICNTVAYAHSRGVLHLDIKPLNVMLGPFGETLVLDWGLAHIAGTTDDTQSSQPLLRPVSANSDQQSRGGTPAYMAPEQTQSTAIGLTPRTDIFLLGATLFEVITGKPPYSNRNRDVVPSAQAVNPAVSLELAQIAARAMSIDPAERFANAKWLAAEVERWLAEEPLAAYRTYLAKLAELVAANPRVADYSEQLARGRVTLGMVLEGMERHSDAERMLGEAISIFERLVADYPNEPRHRADLATSRVHLSRVLVALQRPAEAEQLQASAVKEFRSLLVDHPEDYQTNLASVMLTLMPRHDLRLADPKSPDLPPAAAAATTGPAEFDAISTAIPGSMIPSDPTSQEKTMDPRLESRELRTDHGTLTWRGKSQSAEMAQLPNREQRARLTFLETIGRGGTGEISLMRDNDLERKIVIKELHGAFSADDQARQRLVREAIITAGIDHPGVPPIYGIGYRAQDGSPFISMKHIVGETLTDEIRTLHHEAHPFESPQFRRLMRAYVVVCDALGYAHEKGILHLDPKPHNIMVGKRSEVYLIDWGLACGAGGEEYRMGQAVGTPAYMAPEMASGRTDLWGPPTDVCVIGGTLYHLLTGSPPHLRGSTLEILNAIRDSIVPPARDQNRSIPRALSAICAKAMAKDPQHRYPTASELGADVQRWLDGESVHAYPESLATRSSRRLLNLVGGWWR